MKNIKDYILIISFVFMAIIIFLIINLFINKKTYVELHTSDGIKNDFKLLKSEVNKIKNEKCKNSINSLLEEDNKITFDGKVKLNNFYDLISTDKILLHYTDIKTNCNINIDKIEEYDIPNKYLIKMSLYDSLLSNYFYQYELGFTDNVSNEYYSGLSQIAYETLKKTEIELIKDYLKIVGEK